jgi:hypothetical protein
MNHNYDDIGNHKTTSVASRPLNILHMGLINDAAVWCWLLLVHWCQAMPLFEQQLAKCLALIFKSEPKLTTWAITKPHQLPPDH